MNASFPNQAQQGPRSPEEDASFISRLTYWWIRPLFKIGYQRQLQEHDVYEVLDRYRAGVVGKKLAAAWMAEVERAQQRQQRLFERSTDVPAMRTTERSRNQGAFKIMQLCSWIRATVRATDNAQPRPRLLIAYLRMSWVESLKSGAFVELQDVCTILTPFVIQKILQFVQQAQKAAKDNLPPPPWWHGYGLALLMLIVTSVQVVAAQNWVGYALKASISLRTATEDLVFRKALRLSHEARQQHRFPDGKIVNILTNDSFRLELLPLYIWHICSIPVFLMVIMGFLIHLMGPGPALLGGAILFIATPLQGWVTARLRPWRARLSAIADRRIDLTHQILRAMQVIKLFAWEPSFLRRVTELRSQEVIIVRQLLLARGLISTTSSMVPVLASAASFVLYAAMGHTLDAAIIFPALAFYNSMRAQMNKWPIGFSVISDALVSAKRIEDFLMSDEMQPLPEPDPSCQWAIDIKDGFFYWDRVQFNAENDDGENTDKKEKKMHSVDKLKAIFTKNHHRSSAPVSNSTSSNTPDTDSNVGLQELSSAAAAEDVDPTRHIFLQDIQLRIPRRALVAVIGAVGHGKSSLLQAMVGNMPMHSGRLVRGEATSYAAQQPWIQNATVRDNILFGLPYDADRYSRVIRACQLERDMAALPHGDLTELGERGVNLSGGQKARISLARAVYFQSDDVNGCGGGGDPEKTPTPTTRSSSTVIMDDPLAAVDAHVGKRIWKECILTELQGRTRIVATHQLHVLPDVDLIVCMKDGRIEQVGSYQELMEDPHHDGFRKLVAAFGGATALITDAPDQKGTQEAGSEVDIDVTDQLEPNRTKQAEEQDDQIHAHLQTSGESSTTLTTTPEAANSDDTKRDSGMAGKQIVKEERNYGAITLHSYLQFFHAVGWVFWGGVFGAFLFQQAVAVMMNLWLSYWSSSKYKLTHWQYIGIYLGLVIGQLVFVYLASMILAFAVAKTGEALHRDALVSVLRARMVFFETTPLGRILTRFSKDVDSLDNTLHSGLNDHIMSAYELLGIVVLLVIVIPWMALALPALGGLYYFLSIYSRATTREVKRLDSVKRAERVSFQSASLAGIETIRTFEGSLARCLAHHEVIYDASNGPNFAMQYATRWGAMNGMLVGVLTTFLSNLIIMVLRYRIDAGQVGLVLSYAIQLGTMLNWTLQRYVAMEMAMNSAERLNDYIHTLDHEEKEDSLTPASLTTSASPLPSIKKSKLNDPHWPQHGHIRFSNVWMRYRPELPWSLKNVSFEIQGGQKVGVVGRTGAGKSSLIQVLFRLVEIESQPEADRGRGVEGTEDMESIDTREVEEVKTDAGESGAPSPPPPSLPAAVVVDGIRTDQLALADLRSHMAIIPQDPTLFEGSLRFNLDPLSRFSDQELWQVLEMAELKSFVQDQEGGLEMLVAAQGENLSVGQRQLVCLARALLVKSKVVVLDEATASVDLATDALIQRAIRVDLADSTVITIAHRLNTIIDFDKVLVLDHGEVVEFDSPHVLLSRPGSLFGQLVDETGVQNAAMLRAMAARQFSV